MSCQGLRVQKESSTPLCNSLSGEACFKGFDPWLTGYTERLVDCSHGLHSISHWAVAQSLDATGAFFL
ncbi:hypothetical protein GDO86_005929 [Hymenochirus boettgeri]|uniref:Uncharacterized protein n=1 Tax=Hymenochirus boettgeri TaxID=247094 RepID=A0A8T2J8N7_9PIPI|nr:hypothetical protein GDO86_005929 [Hymenochirus boettgeri]